MVIVGKFDVSTTHVPRSLRDVTRRCLIAARTSSAYRLHAYASNVERSFHTLLRSIVP